MNDWKTRVANEAYELRSRLDKLDAFLGRAVVDKDISLDQWNLLRRQRAAMFVYLQTLNRRLELDAHTELTKRRKRAIDKSNFDAIVSELVALHKRKNADYGDSFAETFRKFGLVSAAVRISDKTNRLCALAKQERCVMDETVEDTLRDLACYAIMTLCELHNETAKMGKE